ncbi:MAG: FAD-dependent oxidoreductase [Desulfobacterales bacterium]|jgi:NADPH-dependent 2,4-dienoyl-CoA reductase/sulfur reductase-like enzyme/rhodanese-related sulfurtransferase
MTNRKKLLIIGGVAGGASCAARARRLNEDAEIIVFERGPFISFANCGLPYHIGKVIPRERSLIVASPEMFKRQLNIEVRTNNNVKYIDRKNKKIEVENLETGKVYKENYDTLVLSPGAAPLKPGIEGIDLPGIFPLRTIPDMRKIIDWIETRKVKKAAVVGGGFIGLEMTENLKIQEIDITIIEMLPQVMPFLDPEITAFIHDHLKAEGISLLLGSPVVGFKQEDNGMITVMLGSGKTVEADLIILAIGVRPETRLAKTAGLALGKLGGILVDDQMRTSDEHIYAVGDAVEIKNFITDAQGLIPLAGPANRQGRMAADVIMGNDGVKPLRFRGSQATMVCGVLGLTIAASGITEKTLNQLDKHGQCPPYEKIYLAPSHYAGYYPGAKPITMKLIFSTENGRILGVQAVGKEGVEKRVDVIATAIQRNGTVFDLEEAELCYAPQYGSAKDPVNIAGMIASNVLRGHTSVVHWENLSEYDAYLLDVRDPFEFRKGHVKDAVHIPLAALRNRIQDLPTDREIWTYCYEGKRSYFALRILKQYGFNVRNISGGYLMYLAVKQFKDIP